MSINIQLVFIIALSLYSIDAIQSSTQNKHAIAPFFRLHHLDPPISFRRRPAADDQWFEQRLDHFNALNPTTWQQRYFSR